MLFLGSVLDDCAQFLKDILENRFDLEMHVMPCLDCIVDECEQLEKEF